MLLFAQCNVMTSLYHSRLFENEFNLWIIWAFPAVISVLCSLSGYPMKHKLHKSTKNEEEFIYRSLNYGFELVFLHFRNCK